ncbi:hypothetical protein ABK040_010005 [Willaertia magna]
MTEVESNIEVHRYKFNYLQEEEIYFLIIILKNSNDTSDNVWIWIGSDQHTYCKFLSVAMQSKYNTKLPLCTQILGNANIGSSGNTSSQIAERLNLKFKKIFIVSYNLKEQKEGELQMVVEKNLFDVLKQLLLK